VYVLSAPSSGNATGQTVDVNAKGYYYYDSTQNKWMKFRCGCDTVPSTVSTFNCSSGTVSGSLISGLPSTGVTVSIPYTGGNGGTYSAQTVSSTGVTGLTASLPAGTLANGSGNVTYTISGTPSGSGSATNYTTVTKFGNTLLLLVAGNRNYAGGSLLTRGSYGFYWSSTSPNTNRSNYIQLRSDTAFIPSATVRTYGFSIHCISE
jgi:hypothetical protein